MKYSMEAHVSNETFGCHIPHQWLKNVTKVSASNGGGGATSSDGSGETENDLQRTHLINQIHYFKSSFSVYSGKLAASLVRNSSPSLINRFYTRTFSC